MKKLLSILLLLAAFVCPLSPLSALAAGAEEGPEAQDSLDTVDNEADLVAWLDVHSDTGGYVTLADTVTLTDGTVVIDGTERITVDTGPYSLVLDGGKIDVYTPGTLAITGLGTGGRPVVDIVSTGFTFFYNLSWNQVALGLDITSTGEEGQGGVALRIRQGDSVSLSADQCSAAGTIRAYGENAVGVQLDDALTALCLNVAVSGPGAVAVSSAHETQLRYCRLSAEGEGARTVDGGGAFTLDTCLATPEPTDASSVNRQIISFLGGSLYFPVTEGSFFPWDKTGPYSFLLSGNENFPAVTESFFFDLSDQLSQIDTSVMGPVELSLPFPATLLGLGLESEAFPLALTVDVQDPALPCIYDVAHYNFPEAESYMVHLSYWDFYEQGENVILWRSDDGGATWHDISLDSERVSWTYGNGVTYEYPADQLPFVLQLEYPGVGESKLVCLDLLAGYVGGSHGGDRDGGDRVVFQTPGNAPDDDTPNDPPDDDPPDDPPDDAPGNEEVGSYPWWPILVPDPVEILTIETPTEQAPPEQSPPEQTPPEETPPEQSPPEQSPPEQTPPEQSPPEQSPPEQTLPEETPPEQSPPEQTPSEETRPEQTPPEETLPEQTMLEQAPAAPVAKDEDTPSANAPVTIPTPTIQPDTAPAESPPVAQLLAGAETAVSDVSGALLVAAVAGAVLLTAAGVLARRGKSRR